MSKKKENGYTYCVFDEHAYIPESSILEILKKMSEEDYIRQGKIESENPLLVGKPKQKGN